MNSTSNSQQQIAATYADAISIVKSKFLEFATNYKVPGVSFALILNNKIAHIDALGLSRLDPPLHALADHVYRIASMTKSFTAMCILILRDKGYITLDDPLIKWVPQARHLNYPTSDSPEVTIRSLLTMSSGLVEDDPWADRLLDLDVDRFYKLLETQVAFDHVPGEEYEYSNLGYALLGQIVTKVTGKTIRMFAEEELLTPLKLHSTTWENNDIPHDLRAFGYSVSDDKWIHEVALGDGAFGAMGGLSSNVIDLANYVLFHLDAWPPRNDPDSSILKRSSRREMAQIHRVITTPMEESSSIAVHGYGYGLAIAHHGYLGPIVGHSGGLPGFTSRMEWLPTFGAGVVALCNRTYVPIAKIAREVLEFLYHEQLLSQHTETSSNSLLEFQTLISELYEHFDQELLSRSTCETFFLDRDDERRPPNFLELRSKYGPMKSHSPIVSKGRLRGTWKMLCEGGELEVSVMLNPTLPLRIQFIKIIPKSATS